ncbi:hypothetical protein HZS_1381 [Henneguya salminicola]|nr:hypothetical protein HZS_1381 [Henneguya salminicola]
MNIQKCSSSQETNSITIKNNFFNQRLNLRFISIEYAIEVDIRILIIQSDPRERYRIKLLCIILRPTPNKSLYVNLNKTNRKNIEIDISDSSAEIEKVSQYEEKAQDSEYNKFDEYHDCFLINNAEIEYILENSKNETNIEVLNLTLNYSNVAYIQSKQQPINTTVNISIKDLHKLFNYTNGIYRQNTEYFDISIKISFLKYLYYDLHSWDACKNIKKHHKCDQSGKYICRNPTKIDYPNCETCNYFCNTIRKLFSVLYNTNY